MGDIADEIVADMICSYRWSPYRSRVKTRYCTKCGAGGLQWVEKNNHWVLTDKKTGKRHQCCETAKTRLFIQVSEVFK